MHRPVHSKPMMGRLILSDITRRAALASGAALAFTGPVLANAQVSVFAAASLKPALDEIAAGWDVTLSYAGSGTLARQVAAGAPADVVLLAATDWMNWLAGQNVLVGDPVPVAGNRLVLVGPAGVGRVMLSGRGISAALGPGRLAMGDPMSVPAGRYAQQALETLGLWTGLSDRLLLTTDVRGALAYVARGDVPLGVVYEKFDQFTRWRVDAKAVIRSGTNDRDYRLGHKFSLGGWLAWSSFGRWEPGLGVSYRWQDKISGDDTSLLLPNPQFPYPAPVVDPNAFGGQQVNVSAFLSIDLSANWNFRAEYSRPVWLDLNGPQSAEDYRLSLGISTTF